MLWLFLPFVIGLVVGVPISIALALGVICFLLISGMPLEVLTMQMYQSTTSFPLMAIPFFILAGDLMSRTGVTVRLMTFSKILVGRIRGGLAQVMVITATVFAGLSGSAVADTAAMAKVLGPDMAKDGYPKDFIASLAASCGVLGPVIPPSTMMIIYGATVNVSIGAMFMGGILPGIVLALLIMATAYAMAVKNDYPKAEGAFTLKILYLGLKDASLALIMPLIIIIGIRGGVFTPTEGGAVAVCYSLILGLIVYKSLTFKDLIESLIVSSTTASIIMLIVAASNPFGWILNIEQIPQTMAGIVLSYTSNKFVILAVINIFLLFVGMFMETAAIIVLLGPILAPIAVTAGVDPVHFGVLMVINLTIGMATPPVGVNLFVAAPIMETTIERITANIIPFITAMLAALVVITYVPQVVLLLPGLFD
ncbi:MAG: C4-dicarboxylate ABC transporter permease [Desulfobacterales bacterium]|nr:MAG: C4-dicarboxylate ABC transporter permease [Desulfobacterales bacterium]